jgi:hypothetical protein
VSADTMIRFLALGALEYRVIVDGLHRVVADMPSIVASAVEPVDDQRRDGVIDQKPHLSAQLPTSGSSRSRTASAA